MTSFFFTYPKDFQCFKKRKYAPAELQKYNNEQLATMYKSSL